MLAQTESELEARALALIEQVNGKSNHLNLSTISGESAIGGGAGPTETLKTTLITVMADSLSAQEIYDKLRLSSPAVIGRISENQVLLDLRTVSTDEEDALQQALLII
jgi:L-seryl-tRNA(Ser) seleniumtransferase